MAAETNMAGDIGPNDPPPLLPHSIMPSESIFNEEMIHLQRSSAAFWSLMAAAAAAAAALPTAEWFGSIPRWKMTETWTRRLN